MIHTCEFRMPGWCGSRLRWKTTCRTTCYFFFYALSRHKKYITRVEVFTTRLQQYCYPILSSSQPPSNFLLRHVDVKVPENGQQKTCNLSCNIICKRSWIAMLHVLPPTFKHVNNLICCKTGLMWVAKRAIAPFNSFCRWCCKTSCTFFVARFSVP